MPKPLTEKQKAARELTAKLNKLVDEQADNEDLKVKLRPAMEDLKSAIKAMEVYIDGMLNLIGTEESDSEKATLNNSAKQPLVEQSGQSVPCDKPIDSLENELFGEQIIPIETFRITHMRIAEDDPYEMVMGAAIAKDKSMRGRIKKLFAYYHILADTPESLAELIIEKCKPGPQFAQIVGILNPALGQQTAAKAVK